MKKLMIALVGMSALVAHANALAQTSDLGQTRGLLRGCRAYEMAANGQNVPESEAFPVGYCAGYMTGLRDGGKMAVVLEKEGISWPFCVPEDATTGDLAAVFVRWAEQHPEEWHRPALLGLGSALRQAFPCK